MALTAPKPFSLSLSSKPSAPPHKEPAATNKRPLAALGGDGDSDCDDSHRGKVQLVSSFDHRGGALDASGTSEKPAAELVIPALQNRDWRHEAELRRRGRKAIYIPPEATRGRGAKAEDVQEVDNTGAGKTYGLQTFERQKAVAVEVDRGEGDAVVLTEDELAIAALTGTVKRGSDMVIAYTAETGDWRNGKPDGNEDDAYRKDVDSRPDVPTLEDYAAVPVEEFGAALLRGMGWKGGEELGGKAGDKRGKLRLVEKRPAFLGIGAKPVTDIPELGAWGKGDKKKRGRPDTTYTPVVKVNKRTRKIVGDITEGTDNGKELERRIGSVRDRSRETERDRNGRKDSGWDKDSRRNRDSGRRENDSDWRRRRDRSPDRSKRDNDRYRENGRDRDRGGGRGRDHRKERDGGRDGEYRRRSRDRVYEGRDRR